MQGQARVSHGLVAPPGSVALLVEPQQRVSPLVRHRSIESSRQREESRAFGPEEMRSLHLSGHARARSATPSPHARVLSSSSSCDPLPLPFDLVDGQSSTQQSEHGAITTLAGRPADAGMPSGAEKLLSNRGYRAHLQQPLGNLRCTGLLHLIDSSAFGQYDDAGAPSDSPRSRQHRTKLIISEAQRMITEARRFTSPSQPGYLLSQSRQADWHRLERSIKLGVSTQAAWHGDDQPGSGRGADMGADMDMARADMAGRDDVKPFAARDRVLTRAGEQDAHAGLEVRASFAKPHEPSDNGLAANAPVPAGLGMRVKATDRGVLINHIQPGGAAAAADPFLQVPSSFWRPILHALLLVRSPCRFPRSRGPHRSLHVS